MAVRALSPPASTTNRASAPPTAIRCKFALVSCRGWACGAECSARSRRDSAPCSCCSSRPASWGFLAQRHRLEVRRQHDLEKLAIVGIAAHGMLDLRRLNPAGAGAESVHALALELALEPALEHVHHLEIDVVIMRDIDFAGGERLGHADDMRLHHAVCRRCDSKIAISGISPQAWVEIFVAMVADGEFLRPPSDAARDRNALRRLFLFAVRFGCLCSALCFRHDNLRSCLSCPRWSRASAPFSVTV